MIFLGSDQANDDDDDNTLSVHTQLRLAGLNTHLTHSK